MNTYVRHTSFLFLVAFTACGNAGPGESVNGSLSGAVGASDDAAPSWCSLGQGAAQCKGSDPLKPNTCGHEDKIEFTCACGTMQNDPVVIAACKAFELSPPSDATPPWCSLGHGADECKGSDPLKPNTCGHGGVIEFTCACGTMQNDPAVIAACKESALMALDAGTDAVVADAASVETDPLDSGSEVLSCVTVDAPAAETTDDAGVIDAPTDIAVIDAAIADAADAEVAVEGGVVADATVPDTATETDPAATDAGTADTATDIAVIDAALADAAAAETTDDAGTTDADATVADATLDTADAATADSATEAGADVMAEAAVDGAPPVVLTPAGTKAPAEGSLQVVWTPPAGYTQAGPVELRGSLQGPPWTSTWCRDAKGKPVDTGFCDDIVAPSCTLVPFSGGVYYCDFLLGAGESLLCDIPHFDSRATNNSAWVFDRSDSVVGGHGKDFGSVAFYDHTGGSVVPQMRPNDGSVDDGTKVYFNAKVTGK